MKLKYSLPNDKVIETVKKPRILKVRKPRAAKKPFYYIVHLRLLNTCWCFVVSEQNPYDYIKMQYEPLPKLPFEAYAMFPYNQLVKKELAQERAIEWASQQGGNFELIDRIKNHPSTTVENPF